MELKALFQNLTVMWTRWSEYRVVMLDMPGGVEEYLVPAPGAVKLEFNCAEHPEILVADALELGRRLVKMEPETHRLCAAFAARHGLLGMEEEITDSGPVERPCDQLLNSAEYGESIFTFQMNFVQMYEHFLSLRGELVHPSCHDAFALNGALEYHLTGGQTPQLVWRVKNMQTVLRLFYAAMVTEGKPGLRVCKNCGKVYYNAHAKSEFCSVRCRNYFNVKVFREKNRDSN